MYRGSSYFVFVFCFCTAFPKGASICEKSFGIPSGTLRDGFGILSIFRTDEYQFKLLPKFKLTPSETGTSGMSPDIITKVAFFYLKMKFRYRVPRKKSLFVKKNHLTKISSRTTVIPTLQRRKKKSGMLWSAEHATNIFSCKYSEKE